MQISPPTPPEGFQRLHRAQRTLQGPPAGLRSRVGVFRALQLPELKDTPRGYGLQLMGLSDEK